MKDLSKEIDQALNLIDAVGNETNNKKKLLIDKGKTVYLQVILFKTPYSSARKRRFLRLHHSLYGDDPEICLFVPNRKTGVEYKKTTDELIDFCIDHYTELLEKHKVKGIKTVMPVKQLRAEYGTYDLRRKLVRRFDLFLCKNSLLYNSRFLTALGKIFKVANKEPLGVAFPKDDVEYDPEFQKNIERAIYTSSFYISRFSDNYSIPFGCLSNTKTQLRENLQTVLNQISKEKIIPGGVKNIRAMYVWPSQSKPIPLYVNPEFPVGMKKPIVTSSRKRVKGVEGDLSSQPHKKVFVTPSGEVFVRNDRKKSVNSDVSDSEDEEEFKDESDDEDGDDGGVDKKRENLKSKEAASGNEEESESESDEEIEKKEKRLLEIKRLTESDSRPKRKNPQNAKQKENDAPTNKKQKQNHANELTEDNESFSVVNKSEKPGGKKGKVNKTERKTLMKQKKLKLTDGPKQKKTKRKV